MPLHPPTSPNNGIDLVQRALSVSVQIPDLRLSALRDQVRNGLCLVLAPYPAYTAILTEVVAGRILMVRQAVGWRYWVRQGETFVAAVELGIQQGTGRLRVSTVESHPTSTELQAVQIASGLDAVTHGTYELRLLRVPGLVLSAIWLKSSEDKPAKDVVIPITSSVPSLSPLKPRLGLAFAGQLIKPAQTALTYR